MNVKMLDKEKDSDFLPFICAEVQGQDELEISFFCGCSVRDRKGVVITFNAKILTKIAHQIHFPQSVFFSIVCACACDARSFACFVLLIRMVKIICNLDLT